jgi:O-antigen/teichoic acid export membrane protein
MEERSEERQRLDRNLGELMTEVRVAMVGVQLLFGFLLAVPFAQRFEEVSAFGRDVYVVSLLGAGAATAFFVAPTAYHRLTFRRGEKRHLVFLANTWVLLGLACMGIAIVAAVLLVTDFLFDAWVACVISGLLAALYVGLWLVVPLMRRVGPRDPG